MKKKEELYSFFTTKQWSCGGNRYQNDSFIGVARF